MGELFTKPLQLIFPLAFGHQRTGTYNEYRLDLPPRLQLPQDQSGLNGLTDPDAIRDQQARTV